MKRNKILKQKVKNVKIDSQLSAFLPLLWTSLGGSPVVGRAALWTSCGDSSHCDLALLPCVLASMSTASRARGFSSVGTLTVLLYIAQT